MRANGPSSLVSVCVLAGAAAAQPSNHIGQTTADIMVAQGCVMSESAIIKALEAQGFGISDFQAQVTALYRGGYLESTADNDLRLVKWGVCK